MKRKGFLPVTLLIFTAVVPLLVVKVQASLSAGTNQHVHTDQAVEFNGTTTDDTGAAIQVTWNFGDSSTSVMAPALRFLTQHTVTRL